MQQKWKSIGKHWQNGYMSLSGFKDLISYRVTRNKQRKQYFHSKGIYTQTGWVTWRLICKNCEHFGVWSFHMSDYPLSGIWLFPCGHLSPRSECGHEVKVCLHIKDNLYPLLCHYWEPINDNTKTSSGNLSKNFSVPLLTFMLQRGRTLSTRNSKRPNCTKVIYSQLCITFKQVLYPSIIPWWINGI